MSVVDQRTLALAEANRIRTLRSQLKRDITAGRQDFARVLAHPPEWLETATILPILLAVPRIGRAKAARALRRADITATTTFGSITPQRRQRMLQELDQRRRR